MRPRGFAPATSLAAGFVLACAVGAPAPAGAQVSLPRAYLTIGGAAQPATGTEHAVHRFELFAEPAEIRSSLVTRRGGRFEVGAGLRLRPRLGVGVVVSVLRAPGTLEATYVLPYPFLFDDPRVGVGVTGADRVTRDLHVQVQFAVAEVGGWQIVAVGGPTYSALEQPLAPNRFRYSYTFPFDTVHLSVLSQGTAKGSGVGGHAGVVVSRPVWKQLAAAGEVRWSSARADLSAMDATVPVQTGGVQAGGSLRIVFRAP